MWYKQIGATCKPLWLFFHLVLCYWCWVYWLGRPWATWKLSLCCVVIWFYKELLISTFKLFQNQRTTNSDTLRKIQNQRSSNLSHFKTLKDQHFFMQDLAKNSMNWWFYAYVLEFFKNLKIMTIYQNWVVEFCLESWLWLRGAILITVEDLFLCWLVWVQVRSQISKFTDR
jgi:hypothetical protein